MAKRQAATWGAKGKAKLEDDDLFKAIGGQLGGDSFDYTQVICLMVYKFCSLRILNL